MSQLSIAGGPPFQRWTWPPPIWSTVVSRSSPLTPQARHFVRRLRASIPIVFVAFADAVKVGLVTNLGRPDGNLTGINLMVAHV